MGAWMPTAGRTPPHVRWPRRIAGVLATGVLLVIAVAIAVMILPSSDNPSTETAATAPTPTATAAPKKQAPHRKALTPAQRRVRAAAAETLRGQGYVAHSLKDYDPHHELRVLLGYRSGDAGGPLRAFFFAGSHYVGTDSTLPSDGLKVSGSGNDWLTLAYGIYSPGDQTCCPSGGHAKVRYEWSGTAVTPVGGTIPSSTERVATG